MSTPEVSAIETNVSSSLSGGVSASNTKIDITKRISEQKAQKIGQTMVSEYCISMNKHMTKNVAMIVDKLDIDNQSEIIQTIADTFFDDDLTDMYISELKATMKVQIKTQLRGILYDHFKSDLEEEKKAEKKREEAEEKDASQAGGNEKDAAGAGDETDAAGAGDEKDAGAGDETDAAGENAAAGETDVTEESAATAAGEDVADMMNQIIDKINDTIVTDDSFIKETRDGIVKNITSGTFKAALQREVFHRLAPQIEKLMKEKIESILNNDEINNAAIDVIKGQQNLYNIQNKRGGKKHTIRKDKKHRTNYTRKSSQ